MSIPMASMVAAPSGSRVADPGSLLAAATRRLEGATAREQQQRAFRRVAMLRYRAHRKRLWALATEVVRAHLAAQERPQSAPPAAGAIACPLL